MVYSVTCGNLVVVCWGCTVSVSSGGMTVICQLHEACWRLSVSYMRQADGCLQGVCVLCQLLEIGWLLSARGVCSLSVVYRGV